MEIRFLVHRFPLRYFHFQFSKVPQFDPVYYFNDLFGPQEKARQQGDHECLHRDMIAGFATWEFDPTELENPFEEGVGSVHMWQGMEDRMIPREINQYISKRLPWIKYHEVPGYGHLLNAEEEKCEDIIKALLV